MVTTFEQIKDTLAAWINLVVGRQIVLANEGEDARPRSPYVEIFLQSNAADTQPISVFSEDGLTQTISGRVLITVDLNVVGGQALRDANNLWYSLYAQERDLDLNLTLGLGGASEIRDLSFLETGSRKQRVNFQVTFYAVTSFVSNTSCIESIDVTICEGSSGYSVEFVVDSNNPKCN